MIWREAYSTFISLSALLSKGDMKNLTNLAFAQILCENWNCWTSIRLRIQVKTTGEEFPVPWFNDSPKRIRRLACRKTWARIIRMPTIWEVGKAYLLGESNEADAVVTSQLFAVTFVDQCLGAEGPWRICRGRASSVKMWLGRGNQVW
jgi:hypothetical protein